MSIVLTEFARPRLFPREPRSNTIQDCTPEAFERRLNAETPLAVLDGYAPFCKLHVHRNWTSTRCMTIPIDDGNRHRLCTAYEARTKDELPVLVRWFEGVEPPVAQYLIPILYSREQMAKEGTPVDADWGVVGCLYTMTLEETPMTPITMMRNALGVEEGGSGVPLDREAYLRSVGFWEGNAGWRPSGESSKRSFLYRCLVTRLSVMDESALYAGDCVLSVGDDGCVRLMRVQKNGRRSARLVLHATAVDQ